MKHVLFASTNPGKIIEIRESLSGVPIELTTLADLNLHIPEPHEHGSTYEENALIKARYYAAASGMSTFADDSGIVVDALNGELGVQTRRWGLGATVSDEEWIAFFLKRMSRETNRRASFLCTIGFIDADSREQTFFGQCDGVITDTVEAPYLPGLPIAGCFRPDGFNRVFSALSLEEKNTISHRGRAMEGFVHQLKTMTS